MLKKILFVTAGIALFSSVAVSQAASITNETTGVSGMINSIGFHNTDDTIGWVNIPVNKSFEEIGTSVDGVINAEDLPEGHYDYIRYAHGPIKVKGKIEVFSERADDTIPGTYYSTTTPLKFKQGEWGTKEDWFIIPVGKFTSDWGSESLAIANIKKEGVGSYLSDNPNEQYDMSPINLIISKDQEGNKYSNMSSIQATFDTNYLWAGKGYLKARPNDYIVGDFKKIGYKNYRLDYGSGDSYVWEMKNYGTTKEDYFLYPNFLDMPEIHLNK